MAKNALLGNVGVAWSVAAGGMAISRRYRRYGIAMLAAPAAGVLVGNACLNHLIVRPRPCWLENAALLIANPTNYFFYLKHTLSSVVDATALTKAKRNKFPECTRR